MIGSINGESSIAPMTTAGDDSNMPRMAIPADMQVISRYRALNSHSARRFSITAAWSTVPPTSMVHQRVKAVTT